MLPSASIALGLAVFLLSGCTEAVKPTRSDLVGEWSTRHGASLSFKADGTFQAVGLPPSYFLSSIMDDVNRFGGHGIWSLEPLDESVRDYRPWEITLNFQELTPNVPEQVKSFSTQVYLAGSSPLGSPPWQVVSWEHGDMDGGDMLVFSRTP